MYKSILDINKSNTNRSTAKYQYSFAKAPRFRGELPSSMPKNYETYHEMREQKLRDLEKKLNYTRQDFYKLPSTKSQRFANFGFHPEHKNNKRNRTQVNFYKKSNDKPLSKEELLYQFAENDFERKYFHGPKYSFPSGREKDPKKEAKQNDENTDGKKNKKPDLHFITPGPGEYNILKPFGSDAPKISMIGDYDPNYEEKKRQLMEKLEKNNANKKTPKPYLPEITIQIRPSGKYIASHIPNVNSVKIQKTEKEKLIENLKQSKDDKALIKIDKILHPFNNPGPGTYTIYYNLPTKNPNKPIKYPKTLMGVIPESKYRSNPPISIGKSKPVKITKSNYPGPGSYRLPSEFGIYVKKGCEAYPEENVYPVKKIPFEEKAWRHGMKKIVKKEEQENNEDENNYEENNENQ